MTRINLVHPSSLADQHLMAEFREIKHIPAFAVDRMRAGLTYADMQQRIPKRFTLDEGHKWFFIDKHKFLAKRFEALHDELLRRRFNVDRKSVQSWYTWLNNIPEVLFNDWQPEDADKQVSIERIMLRINEKPSWYKYFGSVNESEFYKNLMEGEATDE